MAVVESRVGLRIRKVCAADRYLTHIQWEGDTKVRREQIKNEGLRGTAWIQRTIIRYHVSVPTASGTRSLTFVHSSSNDLPFVLDPESEAGSGFEAMLANRCDIDEEAQQPKRVR